MNNTLILTYPTDMLLRKALLRINTAYEGGELKGPLQGVNFPVQFLNDWAKSKTLTDEEKSIVYKAKNYTYVIAAVENDNSTLLHEKAHALFFLDKSYREKAIIIWESLSEKVRKNITNTLKSLGYKSDNFLDEFQAYAVEDPFFFGKSSYAELSQKIKPLKLSLNK
jgi:hypothetical protein